jgi:hypothetical protein
MLASEMRELLHHVRSGELKEADVKALQQAPAQSLIAELRETCPVLFQERSIGRKHEVGVARLLEFVPTARHVPGALFPSLDLLPLLRQCVFLSSYDDVISEITATATIRIGPASTTGELIVKLGRGFEFDDGPDGWTGKPVKPRTSRLSKELLRKWGWNFDALLSSWLHQTCKK